MTRRRATAPSLSRMLAFVSVVPVSWSHRAALPTLGSLSSRNGSEICCRTIAAALGGSLVACVGFVFSPMSLRISSHRLLAFLLFPQAIV